MSHNNYDPADVLIADWKKIFCDYKSNDGKGTICSFPSCKLSANQYCAACHTAAYCNKDHQKSHWKSSHKFQCCPFKILRDPKVGRYVVATRDIEPGEVIMEEKPITVGPRQFTMPVCLGCYKPVDGSIACSKCRWPMCQPKCSDKSIHLLECPILGGCKLKPKIIPGKETPIYECITALRCLLIKKIHRDNWEVMMSMEQHTELRKCDAIYPINQVNIVKFIKDHIKCPDVTEEEINSVIDVMDVNAFEIRSPEFSIRGVYPLTAMMNSVCNPNTQNCIDEEYTCRVRAAVRIPKNTEITTCYTLTLAGSLYRRNHLKESKYFHCNCNRCSDSTELGSHFSTILCQHPLKGHEKSGKICKGFVLSHNPLDYNSVWKCIQCSRITNDVPGLVERIERMIEAESSNLIDVYAYEKLLIELQGKFHPNHHIIMDLKCNMIQLYGKRDPKNSSSIVPIREIERKKELVEEVLDLMTLLIPGYFRLRGMFLSELYGINLFLAKKTFEEGKSSRREFLDHLLKAQDILKEAIEILSYEPPKTQEGARYETAIKFRAQLQKLITDLQNIINIQF